MSGHLIRAHQLRRLAKILGRLAHRGDYERATRVWLMVGRLAEDGLSLCSFEQGVACASSQGGRSPPPSRN